MGEERKIEVIIDGHNFTVVALEKEEYIREIAYYVDKKIRNLSSKNSKLTQSMSATLAALNIADEYYKKKMEFEELEKKSKTPLEKYENLLKEYNNSQEFIESLKEENKKLKDKIQDLENTVKTVKDDKEKIREEIENRDDDIFMLKKEIKSLQDNNYKAQIELIEAKKQASDYARQLEEEAEQEGK